MEDSVLQNLFSGGREEKIRAAMELEKLCSRQRRKLAERGVIAPLISMLNTGDYEAIEAALFALLSLAFGSERNKIRIVKAGIIPVLIELLQCQNESIVELTIAALLIISSCAANKLAITSSGAVPILAEILSRDFVDGEKGPSVSLRGKLDAIATVHSLSTLHQIIPSIVSAGLVFILLQFIYHYEKPSELVQKATTLLENLVRASNDALQQTASTGGAIRALVETIEEGSAQCKEHAVGILLLVCQSCRDKYRGLILMEGVMPGLLQLSVDGTWRAKGMAQELLLLLRENSSYGSTDKESKNEALEQIMQEIDAAEERVMGTSALRLVEEMIAKLSA